MSKVGERVGAILGSGDKTVQFLGYGVYEGDFIPVEAVGGMADVLREVKIENPRIKLDNGSVVYGCECWWGPETAIKSRLERFNAEGIETELVDINQVRDRWTEENKKNEQ
jgi:hypothetical protein